MNRGNILVGMLPQYTPYLILIRLGQKPTNTNEYKPYQGALEITPSTASHELDDPSDSQDCGSNDP